MKSNIFGATCIIALSMVLQVDGQIYQQPTADTTKGAGAQAGSTNINEASGAEKGATATRSTSQTAPAGAVKKTFYLGPKLDELPQAVQDTIKQEAKGQPLDDIDRETWKWNNRVVYEVEFKQDGPDRRIYVADDGSMVSIDEAAGAQPSRTRRLDLEGPVGP